MNQSGVHEWMDHVARAQLSAPVKHTALALATYASPMNGLVTVPQRELARRTGRCQSAVSNHLQELRSMGLLHKRAERSPAGTSVYVLQFPEPD